MENFVISDENLRKINVNEDLIDFFTIDGKLSEKSLQLILKYSDEIIIENEEKIISPPELITKIIDKLISVRVETEH